MGLNIFLLLSFLLLYCYKWMRKERVLRKILFNEDLFSFFACNFRGYKILFFLERNSF